MVGLGACLPDGMHEIEPDEIGVEAIAVLEVRQDLNAGDSGVGSEIG